MCRSPTFSKLHKTDRFLQRRMAINFFSHKNGCIVHTSLCVMGRRLLVWGGGGCFVCVWGGKPLHALWPAVRSDTCNCVRVVLPHCFELRLAAQPSCTSQITLRHGLIVASNDYVLLGVVLFKAQAGRQSTPPLSVTPSSLLSEGLISNALNISPVIRTQLIIIYNNNIYIVWYTQTNGGVSHV